MTDFFDIIKKRVSKGLNTISVKSKEFIETNKVKEEISELQIKKTQIFIDIGKTTFNMYKENNYDELIIKEKCKEINELLIKISEKENELTTIQEEAKKMLIKKED
ncbi:MAG: hypothetical protein EHM58_05220 [Ignavibacteriae bacterium]|nr:MAG: hypothetical protein EHM58_05220 [Ignavibacteriota bacterium]